MDFLRLRRRFRRGPKWANSEKQQDDADDVQSEVLDSKISNDGDAVPISTSDEVEDRENGEEDEEEDDDFITNEVKRRLKEIRKNNFMVLILEEPTPEEEEEEEASSSECKESMEDRQSWYRFDAFYEKYCERMLFFDKICCKQLQKAGSLPTPSNQSPRFSSFKLSLRNLSFNRKNVEFQDQCERLTQQQEEDDGGNPNEMLERVYVSQICLTWEALHCQYMNLCHQIKYHPQSSTCFIHAAQAFQQFQVLLQRFIENEPFDSGSRPEVYSRARCYLPMLLQVPNLHGFDEKDNEDGFEPLFLINILGECILTFDHFLKADKKKGNGPLHLFGDLNQSATSLQQIQNSFEKKEMKLKEIYKKKKMTKKNHWPTTHEEVSVLFGLIDFKVVSRVMRMAKISKEQLLWCEEKICKLNPSDNGLHRDSSPTLFPC
ncbi:hypothetical protein ZOSMA_462G00060 [Zostera marina]|uniref:Uncharacterized protein n=1 Tax=Zostera marina TaxID=29655 RepID=A0A0K9P0C8_ZOSMR|nr:hypothetical protein ZOSMA_462G00060 [Zostera marina]